MDFELTSEHEMIRQTAHDFAEKEIRPVAAQVDKTGEFPKATVLIQGKNLGFGRAANVGLERCTGRFVLLLNPGVVVDQTCVGRLADFMLTR